jgi:hypothetical protein
LFFNIILTYEILIVIAFTAPCTAEIKDIINILNPLAQIHGLIWIPVPALVSGTLSILANALGRLSILMDALRFLGSLLIVRAVAAVRVTSLIPKICF